MNLDAGIRGGTGAEQLGNVGPRLRSPVRGWQRAGDGPAIAASSLPAADSSGHKGKRWQMILTEQLNTI